MSQTATDPDAVLGTGPSDCGRADDSASTCDHPGGDASHSLHCRVVHELGAELDPAAMLRKLGDLLLDCTGADWAGITILDPHGAVTQRESLGLRQSGEVAQDACSRGIRGGLVGRVMRTRRGRVCEIGESSILVVPLLLPTRVVGLVSLCKAQAQFFDSSHLEKVTSIAKRAVTFIENARLRELERQRGQTLLTFGAMASRMSESLNPAHVMRTALTGLLDLTGSDVGRAYVLSADGTNLVSHTVQWRGREPQGGERYATCKLGEGAAGRAAQLGSIVCIQNLRASMLSVLEPCWDEMGMSSVISVPLRVKGTVQGVISLASRLPRMPGHDLCEWLHGMADLVGMSLANALLHSELEDAVHSRTEELARANAGLAVQIEERSRALAELQRERDVVASLMDVSPIGIMRADKTGRLVFANQRAEQIFGLSRSEITQRSYNSLEWCITGLYGEPVHDRRLPFRRIMDTGHPVYGARHAVTLPDGRRVLLSINGLPLFAPTGEIEEVIFTVEDVTGRVRSIQALRASEERWRSLVRNAPDIIATIDRDGRLQFINRAPQGFDKAALLGARLDEMPFGFQREAVLAAMKRVFEDEQPAQLTLGTGREFGSRSYSIRVAPIWEGEEVSTAIVVASDVTERVRTERALIESERKYRAMLNAMPDLVLQLDRAGTYLDVHKGIGWDSILPEAELRGKRLHEVLPLEVADLILATAEGALASGQVRMCEYSLFDEDKQHDYETRVTPSGVDTVLAVVRDITQRKRMQNELSTRERENRALLDAIPDVLSTITRDGTVLTFRASGGLRPLTAPETHVGANIFDVAPSGVAETRMEYVLRALQTHEPQTYEYQVSQDGQTKHFETRIVVSGPDETLSIIRDITDQRQAEQELRVKNKAIDSSISPMALATAEGVVTYANKAFLDLWGYVSEQEVQGKTIFEFCKSPELVKQRYAYILRQGFWMGEDIGVKKDGTLFEVVVNTTLIGDSNGDPAGLMASFADITARKQSERELAQRVAELAALNEIGTLLSNSLDPGQVLESALTQLLTALSLPSGAIYLLDEESGLLHVAAKHSVQGFPVPHFLEQIPAGQGLTGQVAALRKAIVTRAVDHPNRSVRRVLRDRGVSAIINAPILSRDRVIGVLTGASYERAEFTDREIDFMATIGAQIGPSIENANLFKELRQAHESLRALGARLSDTLDQERNQLSRELHDDIGQALTALKLNLQMIRARMGPGAATQATALDQALGLVDETLDRVRFLAAGLRPVALDVQGLVPAIQEQANQFHRNTGIRADVVASDGRIQIGPREGLALYRIVQEALTNVARHAKASRVTISLDSNPARLKLAVTDDGVGFDVDRTWAKAAGDGHLGLVGMKERAELLGADLQVVSSAGKGTQITVVLPYLDTGE